MKNTGYNSQSHEKNHCHTGDIMKRLLLIGLVILIGLSWSFMKAIGRDGAAGIEEDCAARCGALGEDERYRCIRMCRDAKRRSTSVPVNESKKKITACEEECADLKGVDRIKCIRICVEEGKKKSSGIMKVAPVETDPCLNRCDNFSGELRNRCRARCRNENLSGGRSRTRGTKK